MTLISKLHNILKDGEKVYLIESSGKLENTGGLKTWEKYGGYNGILSTSGQEENKLMQGDNIDVMSALLNSGYKGKIKLIYMDPPFFSNADYHGMSRPGGDVSAPLIKSKAYKDSWENGMEEYLTMMVSRLYMAKELLSKDGSIWMHLDWHAVHYVKILMDEIFGEDNFLNEIVWSYKSGGASKKRFSRKHDTLLFYKKSVDHKFHPLKEKSYNRGYKPYRFKNVKEFEDEVGWYTLVNMKDVWQIDMVGRTSGERTGYATQKPEALLDRIIESCTDEGDLCADFFGGSGTLASSAEKNKRKWICSDIGDLAILHSKKRMVELGASFEFLKTDCECSNEKCSNENGKIKLKKTENKMGEIILSIENYSIHNLDEEKLNKKSQSQINQIISTEPIKLLSFLAIDDNFDGKIFCPTIVKTDRDIITKDFFLKKNNNEKSIAIQSIDILGNSILTVI